MKYRNRCIWIFLVLFLLCSCAKPEKPENPYRLKTQIMESYLPDGSNRVTKMEYSYDEHGQVTEIQTYQDDALHYTAVYTRDEYGNALRMETDYSDKTQITEESLTLDAQHRVIYSESFLDGELYATTEYGYDEDGRITKLYINRINVINNQDWKSYVDRTYDRNGNLIREDTRWEPDNKNSGYTLYQYKHDKVVRTESYAGEELSYFCDYSYDKTGLIRTGISCKADGTLHTKHITTYDEFGNQLEVVTYAYHHDLVVQGETDEEPDSRTTYIYELTAEN